MDATSLTKPVPFASSFEAYRWSRAMNEIVAKTGKVPDLSIKRPCTHTKLAETIGLLRASGRLTLQHVRCLDIWATQGREPGQDQPEARAVFIEATQVLDWPFKNKGWVA